MSDFSCDSRIRVNCESCPVTIDDVLTRLKVEKFCFKEHPNSITSHCNYDDNDCVYGFCFEALREAIPTAVAKIHNTIFNLNIKISSPVWGEQTPEGYELIINELPYDDNNTGMFIFYMGEKETPSQQDIQRNHFCLQCINRAEKSFLFPEKMQNIHLVGRVYNDFKVGDICQIVAIQTIAIQNLIKNQNLKNSKISELETAIAAIKTKIDL